MLDLNRFNNSEEKLILAAVNSLIQPRLKKEIANLLLENKFNLNWKKFMCLAQYHQIIPLVYNAFKERPDLIPAQIFDGIKKEYLTNLARNMRLWKEFLVLAGAFNENNIPFVSLKGISFLANLYPDISYRSMVDIDILVKDNSLNLVEDILAKIGYDKNLKGMREEYWRKENLNITFVKKYNNNYRIFLEVHWDLDIKRFKNTALPEVWPRTKEQTIEGRKVRFLSWEDAIFSLALHKRRFGYILNLKEVCDVAYIINKFGREIDRGYILKCSKMFKITAPVYFVLSQVNLLFGNTDISDILRQLDVPRWKKKIINRLILKDTFKDAAHFKNIYLKGHFLLYGSLWEPLRYIIDIPQEQFAKFYGLKQYDKKTEFFYRTRFFYIFFKTCLGQ